MKKINKKNFKNNSLIKCACGCGESVKICDRNNSKRNLVKGKPNRFIRGHNSKGKNHNLYGKKFSQEIKDKMSKSHEKQAKFMKGKTYEKIYGIERAKEIKLKISQNRIAPKGKNHYFYGKTNRGWKHTKEAIKKDYYKGKLNLIKKIKEIRK